MGIRFLCYPGIIDLYQYYGITLTQRTPNALRVRVGFKVQYYLHCCTIILTFLFLYRLQNNSFKFFSLPNSYFEFWQVVISWDHLRSLVNGFKFTISNWKTEYFIFRVGITLCLRTPKTCPDPLDEKFNDDLHVGQGTSHKFNI